MSHELDSSPLEDRPLPRGAYQIDFDNLDEMSNPFQTFKKPKPTVLTSSVEVAPAAVSNISFPAEAGDSNPSHQSSPVHSASKREPPSNDLELANKDDSAPSKTPSSATSASNSKELTKEERLRLRQEQQAKMREMIKQKRMQQQKEPQPDGFDAPIVIAEPQSKPVPRELPVIAPTEPSPPPVPKATNGVNPPEIALPNHVDAVPSPPHQHSLPPSPEESRDIVTDVTTMRKPKDLKEDVGNYRESVNMTDSLELPRETLLQSCDPQVLLVERQLQEKNEEIATLKRNHEEMIMCLKHYEELLVDVLQDTENLKCDHQESLQRIIAERDQTAEDLDTVHKAFNDLHRRHEIAKEALHKYKQNEDQLKETIQQHLNHQKLIEQKYQTFKAQAEKKMLSVKVDIDTSKKTLVAEIDRLKTSLKRAEVQVKSLESQVEQKAKENEELTKICDELLGKHSFR